MGWLTLATSLVLLAATVPASVLKAPRVNTHHTFVSTRDAEPVAKDWYESGVFYQIYPRSFKDSNGDGIGDLKGITEKLDHLKDLGVTGTWLSPIFKSPMNDFGYDIEDFYNVDEIFGSNEELAALFARAKELDIKIILDFVPNHSSKSSQWFVQSEQKINGFDDWYVWRDPKGFTEDGEPIVPCNWQSVFYGSAWTWSEVRQQFYLHQFDTSQPDLNFRNPAVVQEMKNILKHWLDLGADGFRVDAINHLFETEEPIDEPLTGNPDPLSYGYTDHIYTKDMPETYEMVYQWRQFLDEYQAENGGNTRIMMTEAYANHEQVSRYYGANGVEGSHMPFNFLLINDDAPNWDAAKIKYEIDNWLRYVPAGKVSNWVLGNHDKPRMATRYGADRVQGLLALEMGLPGVAVTYYGEEIGMENNMDITWKETVDPQACNNLEEFYQSLSRDPSRTPFQWDATVGTGFSTTADTWLPINKNYVTLNLKAQQEAEKSTYKFYKELIELRKTNALIYGGFVSRAPTDNVFMYKRSYLKEHYVFVINRGAATEQVNLDSQYDGFSGGKVVIASTGSARAVGADVNTAALSLAPYEVLVISYNQVDDHMEWYDNAVFYQIYPRSFKDSDGDGVGDLQGIIEGLDHLKDLGVTGTWLSPIFKSPMRDFGYDIEDFYKVDEIFGTNDDLVALFARAKELDIKIILDFVPNHSSNESEWFIQSEQKLNGFDDWYVWRDPKGFTEDGEPIPPTNWLSVFYGPAWTWSPIRQQFYLHQFDKTQPDLNFRNRAVVDQFVDILWFWLDKGADGFRVDAINHLFETEELIDEPVKEGGSKDPLDHNYLDHIYTTNQDETFEMVYHWREVLNLFKAERASNTKLLMTESYTDPEQIMRFYGLADGTKTGSQMPFNFIMINDVHEDSTAAQIKTIIENWLAIIPEGKSTNWVLGNHDRARVGTRFGTKRIEGFLALEMGLPGIAVTYYGEEIGMENNMDITWEETQDPAACNAPEEEYLINSRDPVRTPFQWDNSEYANFSSGEPWLPVHPNYRTLNLEAQKTASRSIYKFYKQLMELRKKDQFTKGTLKITAPATDVLAFQRFYANSDALKDTYVVVINMGNNERTVNVQDLVGHERATVVLASSSSFVREEAIFNSNAVTLQNYDVVVLQKGSAVAIVVSTFLILASILTTLMF